VARQLISAPTNSCKIRSNVRGAKNRLLPKENMGMRMALETWFDTDGIRPRILGEFEDAALIEVAGSGGPRLSQKTVALTMEPAAFPRQTPAGGASIGTGSSSGSAGSTGSSARFEGDLLHRMVENRRADFDRRPFLLHLNQDDSARMQHQGKSERCDDRPFARRFVRRNERHNASSLPSVSCWRSPYPDHASVRRYLRTPQCCSLHIVFRREG
jgi:hypothetical protein